MKVASDCWHDLERRDLERQRDSAAARLRRPGLDTEMINQLQQQILSLQQRINAARV